MGSTALLSGVTVAFRGLAGPFWTEAGGLGSGQDGGLKLFMYVNSAVLDIVSKSVENDVLLMAARVHRLVLWTQFNSGLIESSPSWGEVTQGDVSPPPTKEWGANHCPACPVLVPCLISTLFLTLTA